MASLPSHNPFGAFINIDDSPHVNGPSAVFHKDPRPPPISPKASTSAQPTHELDDLPWASRYNGSQVSPTPTGAQTPFTPSGVQDPITPNELEMSRPPSPKIDDAADAMQTLSNPPMNKYRLLSACFMCFGNGLNDSAPGALIPYMEKDYHVGYAIVSLIFITNAIGFISAAPITHALQARLGRANMLVLAESLMIVAYIMLVCTPPFPVVVLAFFFIGLGIAFGLSLNNVFCANLTNSTMTLGAFHGSYGIGGTIGPLIATALVSHGHRWSTFYIISLAVTVCNLLFAFWAFRTYERDNPQPLLSNIQRTASRPQGVPVSKSKLLKQALKNKTTILGSLFIFAYQGAEVSISGWVISFLISYRHSSPSRVGYVTSGFWAGITIGRFALSHPAHKIGEKTSVVALVIGAAAFQLLVWLLPNTIGEAVAVSIVGLLLGPVYPLATAIFSRLVARDLQLHSLATVSAMGSSGGAVMPFVTGLVAQGSGTWVLHPICIGLFAGMLGCWAWLPRVGKRRE